MSAPTSSRSIRFATFKFEAKSQALYKEGVRIKLAHQPSYILSMLLEHPGEVITREVLRQTLWSRDTFVDFDQGIDKAITKLREALCDHSEHPMFIETIPKCGYRFIGRSEVEHPLRWHWLAFVILAAISTLLALAAINVGGLRHRLLAHTSKNHALVPSAIECIAVLPLENLSNDPAQESLVDGLTDTLITVLGSRTSLRVISGQSTKRYKKSKQSLTEITHELNVEAVVEGTVQRSEHRLRINIQLVQAPNDRHLWAKSYDRSLGDILALQDEVTRDIASHIGRVLRSMGTPDTALPVWPEPCVTTNEFPPVALP